MRWTRILRVLRVVSTEREGNCRQTGRMMAAVGLSSDRFRPEATSADMGRTRNTRRGSPSVARTIRRNAFDPKQPKPPTKPPHARAHLQDHEVRRLGVLNAISQDWMDRSAWVQPRRRSRGTRGRVETPPRRSGCRRRPGRAGHDTGETRRRGTRPDVFVCSQSASPRTAGRARYSPG